MWTSNKEGPSRPILRDGMARGRGTSPRSILVVTSQPLAAKDLESLLSRLGYVVTVVASEEGVIAGCVETQPDLVLIDMSSIKQKNGMRAADKIRRLIGVPVVFAAAGSDGEALGRAKEKEPFRYVADPFDERELHATIEGVLYGHRIEQRLRESEEKYRTLFQTSKDAIFTATIEGGLADCNRSFLNLFQVLEDEVIGMPYANLFVDRGQLDTFENEIKMSGEVKDLEVQLRRGDGASLHCLITAHLVRDKGDRIIGLQGSIRDVTEQRHLEAKLFHLRKLEETTTLACGIAHDFNNILTSVAGYADMLRRELKSLGGDRYLDGIEGACDKASHLAQGLLSFSSGQAVQLKPTDANMLIMRSEGLISTILGEGIVFQTRLSESHLPVLVDAEQIEQMIANLVTNARDAMPEGGTFIITTEPAVLEDEPAQEGGGEQDKYAHLAISDTGIGMDAKTCDRIFEPFFTTKQRGQTRGLGLSIVYGIVRQHNGHIRVSSEPGLGTTIHIYLPLADPAVPNDYGLSFCGASGCRGTILLAEDDIEVRAVLSEVLREYRYTVLECEDGEEAIWKARKHLHEIDMAILDLVMPKMTGRRAYEEIVKLRAGMPVIFISGYSPETIKSKGISLDDIAFMPKPIMLSDLLEKVGEILDSRQQAEQAWR